MTPVTTIQKNVEHDLKTDLPNFKDPLILGKLPPDAQPSSDYEEQDDISSQMEKLEGKSAKKKRNEEDLFSGDEDNGSISIVDEIISKLDVNKFVKDQLVSKSIEAWCLDNSKQLLSDAIYHSAIVVSETGDEIQKFQLKVNLTLLFLQLNLILIQMNHWSLSGEE